ncbi:tetratricopeptide repeat protein [Jannaschia sp. LMIT008]|uniref:tetratricopeptide repeat protein n=1 Tax=Jannaschia maritima TaxID=3032585 RepID=UPI0028111F42|nr:tetratricopeptide repeat protein [Jannaschia sp. LMIT008]
MTLSRVSLKALIVAAALCYATSPVAQDVLSDDPDILLDELAVEGDPGEATRLAGEVVERWSHSGSPALDLLMERAVGAAAEGDFATAIAHLTAVTDHAPEFAEGWNRRAETFFRMERYGAALADIEQVLILEPRHFGALGGAGVILDILDRPHAALAAFRRAAEIYPAEENIRDAIARLEQETGGRSL